ncbi:MAG: hypothetical protein ACRCYB_12735 [Aeromonas veronii]
MITIPETFMAIVMLVGCFWILFTFSEKHSGKKLNKPFLTSACCTLAVVAMTTGVWLVRLGQMMAASL